MTTAAGGPFTIALVFKEPLAGLVCAKKKDVTRRLIRGEKTRRWREGALAKLYNSRPEYGGKALGEVRIISCRREALEAITPEDVPREGYPELTRSGFVQHFLGFYGLTTSKDVSVWRVEFELVTLYEQE
jgi:hypothetical protein